MRNHPRVGRTRSPCVRDGASLTLPRWLEQERVIFARHTYTQRIASQRVTCIIHTHEVQRRWCSNMTLSHPNADVSGTWNWARCNITWESSVNVQTKSTFKTVFILTIIRFPLWASLGSVQIIYVLAFSRTKKRQQDPKPEPELVKRQPSTTCGKTSWIFQKWPSNLNSCCSNSASTGTEQPTTS